MLKELISKIPAKRQAVFPLDSVFCHFAVIVEFFTTVTLVGEMHNNPFSFHSSDSSFGPLIASSVPLGQVLEIGEYKWILLPCWSPLGGQKDNY